MLEHAVTDTKIYESSKPTVLVIGAGISGLSAAQVLSKTSHFNVKVIEARDRIGGRVATVPMGESKTMVDIGASWIHGIGPGVLGDEEKGFWKGQMNPIYNIAKENNFLSSKTWNEHEKGSK